MCVRQRDGRRRVEGGDKGVSVIKVLRPSFISASAESFWCVVSLPCPRPAGSRSGELHHTRTVAVGKEQVSESRKTQENAFTGNPDYSVLSLVGRLRVK